VDVHGSTAVWRKWINVVNLYKVEILILAGDLTGKAVVPIFDKNSTYEATVLGKKYVAKNQDELQKLKAMIENMAYYYAVMTANEANEIAKDSKKVDELFQNAMIERIKKWLNLLLEKVDTKNVITIVMPGNDDEQYIDETIKGYGDRNIIYPLDKTVPLPHDLELVSHEFTNPTPWKTPREADEDKLYKIIEEKIKRSNVKNYSKTIFNFHCPPFNTNLDLAPKLDKNMKIVYVGGKPMMLHVGSTSIRKLIEKYQPLLGLHGHIHESYASDKIRNSVILNPGSEYTEGILRGFFIEFDSEGLKNYWKIEG
jgi:Icc-related predicted phosphoesterase